ncbi:MAG: SOS response-associated peptidase [Proteobacteria bacterium]|nr:SOS response-associated peptidase [Pseudomonadota bacterium]
MCGRFSLSMDLPELQEAFPWVEFGSDFKSRYNIAPSQDILVVPNDSENRARWFRWGLIPPWAKDMKIGYKMINARSETLAEKPSFKNAYRKRRCLIPAGGFYEWKKEGKAKTPFHIRMKSTKPFAFAGLWEKWQGPGGELVFSCTIITTDANDLLRPIHARMPVILPQGSYERWLDTTVEPDDRTRELLQPYPSQEMEAYPVSKRVNSPGNDSPDCIQTQLSF